VRFRRRAVRQAAGLIAEYAGHAVPDQPTSPGENVRVLPEPFLRVPDDQIYSPITRRRRLFAEGLPPLSPIVRDCFNDLDDPEELRELGTALFLDRPLGFAKGPGEPDQTLLASHVLFSRSLAAERLRKLAGLAGAEAVERWQNRLWALPVDGLPLTHPGPPPRPGVVSLHDALRVADDFLILRTTRQTIRDFAAQFDLSPLTAQLAGVVPAVEEWRLLIPGGGDERPTLCVFDQHLRPRLELLADLSRGYGSRGGVEFPTAGLRVMQAWDGNAGALDLRGMDIVLQPKR
jgi:hypothetical protein